MPRPPKNPAKIKGRRPRKIISKRQSLMNEDYRHLIDNDLVGIYKADFTGRYSFVNGAMWRMFGYDSAEEMLKEAILPRWKNPRFREVFIEALKKTGRMDCYEFDVRVKTGKTKNFLGSAAIEGGEILGTNIDITDRKTAEKALRETEKRYYGLYESVKDGIFRTDMSGRILESNQAWRDMLGYDKKEVLALAQQQLTPVGWQDMERDIIERGVLARGYSDEYEKEYIKKDGITFPVSLRVWLIKDEKGRPCGMWGIARDITERKDTEQGLKKVRQELESEVKKRTAELLDVNRQLKQEIVEREHIEKRIQARNDVLRILAAASSRKEYLDSLVDYLKEWSGCRCVGVRVLNEGDKIPYESYAGFSPEFWQSENWLSVEGNHCLCARVVTGKPEPQDRGLMTAAGSFYCGNILKFVNGLSEQEKNRFRGMCWNCGFSCVVLIPLSYKNTTIGAIHMADEKEGRVSARAVEFIESLAPLIGEGIYKFNIEDKVRQNHMAQSIINSLLRLSLKEIETREFLARALEMLFSVTWLALEPKGGIFLVEDEPEQLVLHVQRGWKSDLPPECARVAFGDCICGAAAQTGQIQFSADALDISARVCAKTASCSSYGVPILSANKVLGVLHLCLKEGYPRDYRKEEFLAIIATALAGILQRKRAEDELKLTQQELMNSKRLADIGTLAATIAHELRNPLGVIRTAAYNIKRKTKDASLNLDSHLVNIEKKILEADQTINNLLFYSRIKAAHYEAVRVYDVLRDCMDSQRKRFAKWRVSERKKIEAVKNDLIYADRLQMSELFNNILSNAYEALPDRKGKIEVEAAKDAQGNLRISFKDDGSGMEQEDIKRVFEPFFTRKAQGTGLGLAVCFQIINLHGGKIDVESQKGRGSSFVITLPVKESK